MSPLVKICEREGTFLRDRPVKVKGEERIGLPLLQKRLLHKMRGLGMTAEPWSPSNIFHCSNA